MPTNRDVWRIAAPMILSNVSVPLLGMVDTGVVGHLESPVYLGAVAIGATIFGFLYNGVNFLRMGTTGITAQRYGADDYDGLRVSLGQALIVAQLIALLLLLLQGPLGRVALGLIGAEPDVEASALEYFSIRIWSAPGRSSALKSRFGSIILMPVNMITLTFVVTSSGIYASSARIS